jgi:radical SAM superfamily enzyme
MTRETGHDEAGVGMCAYCYLRSQLENSLDNESHTPEQFQHDLEALNKRYRRTE